VYLCARLSCEMGTLHRQSGGQQILYVDEVINCRQRCFSVDWSDVVDASCVHSHTIPQSDDPVSSTPAEK